VIHDMQLLCRERLDGEARAAGWGRGSSGVGQQEQQSGAVGAAGWGGESDRVGLLELRWGGARTEARKES
jgi:hypothetical protein